MREKPGNKQVIKMTNKELIEKKVKEISKAYAKANVAYECSSFEKNRYQLLINKAKLVGELEGYNWILDNLKL